MKNAILWCTSAVKSLVSGNDIIASVAYMLKTVLVMSVQMVFSRWRHSCDCRSSVQKMYITNFLIHNATTLPLIKVKDKVLPADRSVSGATGLIVTQKIGTDL